jgi:asparagine synthase (glutamine-hydrolysing)
MCGIVGYASRRPHRDRSVLLRQRDEMRHRGPDDAGIWWSAEGGVGLGHRRLSIVDLSPLGHQPMSCPEGRLHLVFNGEIYNFRELRDELRAGGAVFRSASDTEVLLQAYRAWGSACVERFTGMFAFVVYDERRRVLFGARDRAGEKPFFYLHHQGAFSFASELKALMADPACPRTLDPTALEQYLAYGYVSGSECILAGARKLPQGHAFEYALEADSLRTWRYWELPTRVRNGAESAEVLAEELEGLLEDAVRRQMVADVPVGVLLSGGIDSSLVTALAARSSSGAVRTFTISFPGHAGFDEAPYARLVAEHFGTVHTELVAEPATVSLLPELARQFDEPMADSSMVPTFLVSRLIREHATVALGGDGGDELFGGYPHYSWIQRHERLRRNVPLPVRRLAGAFAGALPVGMKGRNYLTGLGGDGGYALAHINMYFDARTRAKLLAPLHRGTARRTGPERAKARLAASFGSALESATGVDFQTYMVDDILVKVDRASMLASLEVRAPFLDHHVIEFAFGRVPARWRATESERKIVPRILAERLLPSALDLRRKQGFTMPLASWFRGEWGTYMREVLRSAPPELFDPGVIGSLVRGQERGYSNTQRLFALVMLELWRREYDVQLPT